MTTRVQGLSLRLRLRPDRSPSASGFRLRLRLRPDSYLKNVNILAQRTRLWVTPVRGWFTVEPVKSEIRISKPETNPKFECSNVQNNQESIHCATVNLFGTLEFWSLEFVSYFVFRASNFVSIYFGRAIGL